MSLYSDDHVDTVSFDSLPKGSAAVPIGNTKNEPIRWNDIIFVLPDGNRKLLASDNNSLINFESSTVEFEILAQELSLTQIDMITKLQGYKRISALRAFEDIRNARKTLRDCGIENV